MKIFVSAVRKQFTIFSADKLDEIPRHFCEESILCNHNDHIQEFVFLFISPLLNCNYEYNTVKKF